MIITNEARFTFETSRTQQASLPGNVTLTFNNGLCSDTESTEFKGKNLAVILKHSLISTNFLTSYSFLYIFQ